MDLNSQVQHHKEGMSVTVGKQVSPVWAEPFILAFPTAAQLGLLPQMSDAHIRAHQISIVRRRWLHEYLLPHLSQERMRLGHLLLEETLAGWVLRSYVPYPMLVHRQGKLGITWFLTTSSVSPERGMETRNWPCRFGHKQLYLLISEYSTKRVNVQFLWISEHCLRKEGKNLVFSHSLPLFTS